LEVAGMFAPAYAIINGEIPRSQITETELDSVRIMASEAAAMIDIDIEYARLRHFLIALAELPESVRPAILTQLFSGATGAELESQVDAFLEEQRTKSVIFNTDLAAEILAMKDSSG